MKMHQYKCDKCGASLDPGERCDCSTEKQNVPDQAGKDGGREMQENSVKTNIIKLRFIRNGEPQGREYTYYTPTEVEVGDIVELEAREGIAKGIVTKINVPEEEIAPFKDRAKAIIGKAQIKEEGAAE
jgi:uncharacterized Zn finger protein